MKGFPFTPSLLLILIGLFAPVLRAAPSTPAPNDPFAAREAVFDEHYRQAPLPEKYAMLQTWARDFALPIFARAAAAADPKFKGVTAMGKLVLGLDYQQRLDVEKLTFQNSNYWRGVMEMVPGDPTVSALPGLLFVANGEMDKAERMLDLTDSFTDEKTPVGQLVGHIRVRVQKFRDELAVEINRGIALHDRKHYADALAIYAGLEKNYPRSSAWLRYETFYSTLFLAGPEAMKKEVPIPSLWPAAAPDIYSRDPLYTTQFGASRGKTMAALIDRLKLGELFKNQAKAGKKFIPQYAELALKLEAYGYAAQLYWYSIPLDKANVGATIEHYLYCLEQLGVHDLKDNFTGDHATAFKAIDSALAKHRSQ